MSLPAERIAAPAARPAPPARREHLNLARRPFVNTRPVFRVSMLLWLLGLLLLLGNVSLYWSYLAGSDEKRAELSRIDARIVEQQRVNQQLQSRLAGLDLRAQNRQVRYLNRKIAERTFSWSRLFDDLAAVLPDQVRLTSLTPSGVAREESRRNDDEEAATQERGVQLVIHGVAKSDEALLQFVDRLFVHPFEDPDLPRESREEDNEVDFDIRVTYLPDGARQDVVIEEAPLSPALPTPGMPAPPASPAATESEIE